MFDDVQFNLDDLAKAQVDHLERRTRDNYRCTLTKLDAFNLSTYGCDNPDYEKIVMNASAKALKTLWLVEKL